MEDFIIKVFLVTILSGLIGIEREIRHKAAGIRTHILVGLAAFIFTYFSILYFGNTEAARIIANILVGMGFIGAGVIIKEENFKKVVGITTAASLWFTASIGILVGLNFLIEALVLSIIGFFVLASKEIYLIFTRKYYKW
ncbi:MAG: MgtC/SapB family protein [Candidatus Aenigmatarchaeota archaeon]